ncbi:MAG TPA: hypothetical protein VEP91_05815 [Solirubrobacterales bacterium]|nr:hypothetical protein [Solirubrobacterales bacterium]
MRLAVHVAGESVAEDERAHPRVGAVLASPDGEVLAQCHRGEVPGTHAEYRVFERAREEGIETRGCVLFATLEPCTQRGSGKIPCAERVAAAELAAIYIGTLDPNPNITGRGELFLDQYMDVGRFPIDLARELREMNEAFFAQHLDRSLPAVSLYASRGPDVNRTFPKPRLSDDRNELLQQTLDLVSGDPGDVWVRAGDLSWWREAQITFLEARLRSREVRISANPAGATDDSFDEARAAAEAIGAVVLQSAEPADQIRGTMVSPGTDRAAMVVIDAGSRSLLRSPDDKGLLSLIHKEMAAELDADEIAVPPHREPRLEPLSEERLVGALRSHVPQYAEAEIRREEVEIEGLRPLTRNLERFKIFRAARLEALKLADPAIGEAVRIVGSPWPITPPVVERRDGGLFIVDGTHRAFMHLRNGVDQMSALVVEGVDSPLPARPLDGWEGVHVFGAKLPRGRRYDDYDQSQFRPIRRAFATLAA